MIKFDHDNSKYEISEVLVVSETNPIVEVINEVNHPKTVIENNTFYNAGYRPPTRWGKLLMKLRLIPKSQYVLYDLPNVEYASVFNAGENVEENPKGDVA